jgi:hypothetical protein
VVCEAQAEARTDAIYASFGMEGGVDGVWEGWIDRGRERERGREGGIG